MDPATLDAVAHAVRDASSVLFVTGAGLSADSGLPTYRGVGGLYNRGPTRHGMPIEIALSGHVFRTRPEVSWEHIRDIEQACRGAQPNAGHRFMAALEATKPRVWTLTQNVDGLHRAAGSTKLIEIHGRVDQLSCTACGWGERVSDYAHLDALPTCPSCGAVIRPNVVLFGEMLPAPAVADLERELNRGFDVVFSVGTSGMFPYITAPVTLLGERGAITVEVNPGTTDVSGVVTHRLQAGAAQAFAALAELLGMPTG